jgi:hypothetical protein
MSSGSGDTGLCACCRFLQKTRIRLTNSWVASLSTCGRGVTPAIGASIMLAGCWVCFAASVSCSKADRNGFVLALAAVVGRGLFRRGEGKADERRPGELVLGLRNGFFDSRLRDNPGDRRCSAAGGTGGSLSVLGLRGYSTYHADTLTGTAKTGTELQTNLAGWAQ